jgi:hypothetical protein
LSAPGLLDIIESKAKEQLMALSRAHDSAKDFEPITAALSRPDIPEQVRYLCELVATARGAVPLPVNYKS